MNNGIFSEVAKSTRAADGKQEFILEWPYLFRIVSSVYDINNDNFEVYQVTTIHDY